MNKELQNVLWESVKQSFKGKIWKFLLGSFPSLITILLLGRTVFDTTTKNSFIIGISLLGLILLIRMVAFLFRNISQYYAYRKHESKYGNAIIYLKDSFSKAHHYRKTPGHQDKEFMKALIDFCDNLKKTFDGITKGNCSVCIKVPFQTEDVDANASMQNLCRDPEFYKIRDTESYKKTNHTIIGNTAFQKALNNVLKDNDKKYYLNNAISKTVDYENTSKDSNTNGKLSYESELVYPIIPMINDDPKNIPCKGFLCIDCDKENAFNENYDVAIIEGVADGIYDLLLERAKNNNNNG
jgi:flagellar biogenesis protein FliO